MIFIEICCALNGKYSALNIKGRKEREERREKRAGKEKMEGSGEKGRKGEEGGKLSKLCIKHVCVRDRKTSFHATPKFYCKFSPR